MIFTFCTTNNMTIGPNDLFLVDVSLASPRKLTVCQFWELICVKITEEHTNNTNVH